MAHDFPDHFSSVSRGYAAFRPRYPDALFAWLADAAPGRGLAWDVATGSGQAALGLAARFDRVVASDASAAQIAAATAHPRVEYRVAAAHDSGLGTGIVDLVTVAQALHWLDRPRFFAETERVLRPGGVAAAWSYGRGRLDDPACDAVLQTFYEETVGRFWPVERAVVDAGYAGIGWPFAATDAPAFAMEQAWTREELVGYVGTWSATARCLEATGEDPLPAFRDRLTAVWGTPARRRRIAWPLTVLAGRRGSAADG